jgi:hypothetical protein
LVAQPAPSLRDWPAHVGKPDQIYGAAPGETNAENVRRAKVSMAARSATLPAFVLKQVGRFEEFELGILGAAPEHFCVPIRMPILTMPPAAC